MIESDFQTVEVSILFFLGFPLKIGEYIYFPH